MEITILHVDDARLQRERCVLLGASDARSVLHRLPDDILRSILQHVRALGEGRFVELRVGAWRR